MESVRFLVKRLARMNDRLWSLVDARLQSAVYYVAYHRAGVAMRAREPTRWVRDLQHSEFKSIAFERRKSATQDVAHARFATGSLAWRYRTHLPAMTRWHHGEERKKT